MDISGWYVIRGVAFWGLLGVFLLLELKRPYREPSVSKLKRWANNLGMTILNGAVVNFLFAGALVLAAVYATEKNTGVLNAWRFPLWANVLATVLFMDFMLWVWHLVNHEIPLLWRFHRVHHTDLDMDVSTATRFHLGELAASLVIKCGLVYFLGAQPVGVLIFETLLVATAQFHHSSLLISPKVESYLWPLFVPPSMHRIHHSVKVRERDTNYGTILSLWDRVFGTFLKNVDQDKIRIGVGGHYDEKKLNLHHLLLMPFWKPVK